MLSPFILRSFDRAIQKQLTTIKDDENAMKGKLPILHSNTSYYIPYVGHNMNLISLLPINYRPRSVVEFIIN